VVISRLDPSLKIRVIRAFKRGRRTPRKPLRKIEWAQKKEKGTFTSGKIPPPREPKVVSSERRTSSNGAVGFLRRKYAKNKGPRRIGDSEKRSLMLREMELRGLARGNVELDCIIHTGEGGEDLAGKLLQAGPRFRMGKRKNL